MKARFVFACAAAGIALMSFGATNAAAEANSSFEASPGEVRAGDTITLSGTCDHPDFTAPAPTESSVLHPTTLTGEKDAAGVWHVSGTTTVKNDAAPGQWSVLFSCAPGDVAVADFTIIADEPNSSFSASPREVRPGDTITLSGTCDHPDFTAPAPTESSVLHPTTLTGEKDQAGVWHVTGTTTVKNDAPAGPASVLFSCAPGDVAVADFTIIADNKPATAKQAQVPVKPKGAADTGALQESPDHTAVIGAGAAALLVAGGVGVWTHRRRA